jgi:predicted transposase/invertase (TIGR01784 family)
MPFMFPTLYSRNFSERIPQFAASLSLIVYSLIWQAIECICRLLATLPLVGKSKERKVIELKATASSSRLSMNFISPTIAFAFKKIFGSEQSQGILVSFLNGLLYGGASIIEDLTILNPYQAPRIRGIKDTYLDVKAQLVTGEIVIIEMQVLNVEGFEKRILYNAAKAYSIQLKIGDDYPKLNPVIALTITDFLMFPEIDAVITRFILKEKNHLIDYPVDDLELVFVELPKFSKVVETLETLTEKWIYFLQHARDIDAIPPNMGTVTEIEQAFAIANRATLSPDELEELEHQEIFVQDQRGAIQKATTQGFQQGMEKGRRSAQLDVARRLLDSMTDDAIAQITELPLADIAALRQPEAN